LDVFGTLAKFTGSEIPQDRILDGVDQSGFLMGKSEKSARESVVIYIGNELFYLDDTWVDAPLWQVIEDHEASIEKDPGTPDP